jgi:uncharacterized protein YndB with AHSA1/START domain
MKKPGSLEITTPSERELRMTRVFDAPKKLLWEAFTKPELLERWMLGPDGWSLEVEELDLRVGGRYRYVWSHAKKPSMGMGGVYREIVVPERIVSTELFDDAWYPGEAVGTLLLIEKGGKTTLQQTMLYESRAARDAVLKSGMESGVIASYDRLAKILAE